MRFPTSLALVVLAWSPLGAQATFSIAAVDARTMEVGGSGASCVGSFVSIYTIYGSVPGTGVVHAQALLSTRGRDRAVALMAMGETPPAIITALTDPAFDAMYERRQYGIVDLSPASASFTGASTLDYAGDVRGTVETYTYSIQGNILTSGAVLDQARDAFEAEGCDLADRLMRALEAGGAGGEGDSRCTGDGIPSDGAFLQVDRPGEPRGAWLSLRVDDTAPEDPLALLRVEYDAWRADNPCPAATPPDGGASGVDAGPEGLDAGFSRDSGAPGDAGPPAATRGDGGSCGCETSAGRADGLAVLFFAALALAVRLRARGP